MSTNDRGSTFIKKIYRNLDLLFVIFAALKIAGLVPWPWWKVCEPLFAELAIVALALLAAGVGAVITARAELAKQAKK